MHQAKAKDFKSSIKLPRRTLLAAGLAGLFSACAPDPLLSPETADSVQPIAPDKTWATDLAEPIWQLGLQAALIAQLVNPDEQKDEAIAKANQTRDWCQALADCYQQQGQIISQYDPLAGVQGDRRRMVDLNQLAANPSQADLAALSPADRLVGFGKAQQACAQLIADHLPVEKDGARRLTLLSVLFNCQLYAKPLLTGQDLGVAPIAGDAIPTKLPDRPLAELWQVLISKFHALVFGLETMIGKLSGEGDQAKQLRARLSEAMRQRAEFLALLDQAKINTTEEITYQLPGNVDDLSQFGQIRAGLEKQLLAAMIEVAAFDAERFDWLSPRCLPQAELTRGLGISLNYWLGWAS